MDREFLPPGEMSVMANNNAVITVTCFMEFYPYYLVWVSLETAVLTQKKFNTEV